MRFHVETASAVPIYAQLIEQVQRAIAAGVLRPGDPLPSLRELASHLRVNPLTVARAYRELEAQGIIRTGHGRGSVVSPQAADLGDAYRRTALTHAVDRLLSEAGSLGVSPDDIRAMVEARLRAMEPEIERK